MPSIGNKVIVRDSECKEIVNVRKRSRLMNKENARKRKQGRLTNGIHLSKSKYRIRLLVLIVALAAMFFISLSSGKYSITTIDSLEIFFTQILNIDYMGNEMDINVIMDLRLPRVIGAILVGGALALAGCVYQSIFSNPLISPDFLGVSAGASLGAAIGILLSVGGILIQLLAFSGGIVAVILAMSLPIIIGNRSNIALVLSGIIVGSAFTSLLGLVKYLADPAQELAAITYWSMGNFSYIQTSDVLTVLPIIIICSIILFILSWQIDIISLGEMEAKAIGVKVSTIRTIVIICATLITAAAVCIVGTIGWVGLVVPHFARILVGPSNRRLIPIAILCGSLFMLTIDTIGKTISPIEMPVSILTGLIGAPTYAFILFRQRKVENSQ